MYKRQRLGFVVNQERVLAEDMEQIWDFIQKVAQLREDLPYDIDGIVIKAVSYTHLDVYKRQVEKRNRWAGL